MMRKFLLFLLAILVLGSCKKENSDLPDRLYAKIETSRGVIIAALAYKKAPVTVANFVTLAEGKNTFVAKEFRGKPFYNNLKWHRVIPQFMIQGGDPLGNGSGDAGYRFVDEITDLKHDKPGVLSMANSGPGTNSSQFFITHVATPWLDGLHTIFGNVVKGQDVVDRIQQNDDIQKIEIMRIGPDAKKFDAVKVFADYFTTEADREKKQAIVDEENNKVYDQKFGPAKTQLLASFEAAKKSAKTTKSGLKYTILEKGSNIKPKSGTVVYIDYAGYLEDGTLFDTSMESAAQEMGKFDTKRAQMNGYRPLEYELGTQQLIPGFVEGLLQMNYGETALLFIPSNLAYGQAGAGGVIPPNANIIFKITLKEKP